jgi:HlyD family secretion protein
LAVLVVCLGAGALAWKASQAGRKSYLTAVVDRGAVARSITASGTVNPQLTITVGSYISGVVQSLACDFNTRVKRGQVCAQIDPGPYQATVDQDAAALATAAAQVVKDKASLAYASLNLQRGETLLQQDSISRDAVDVDRSSRDQAQAQVALDQATVEQRQAALKAAQINLNYTRIISPVDGTVVSRNVTQGQTVAASFQTPTLFLIASDLTKMQVDANVSESDIGGSLKVGDRASFTVQAFPNQVFHGLVTQVRQAPQTVQNVITYDVVISADNPNLLLKPGMTATARIVTDERANVIRAPNQALRYQPSGLKARTGRAGADRVYILRNGKPARIAVSTGLADDSFTEISTGGLKPGDAVIVSEQSNGQVRAAPPRPAARF